MQERNYDEWVRNDDQWTEIMRHFQPIMKSEILRDAENLRHNNNWDMVHCMRRRDSLQVAAESWNAEPGKHFPTPVTSSCNVTDSALQSVTAWQSRARHKMSLGAVQYFLRVMPPVLPESPQWLSLAASQAHTRPIFGGIVPVPSFLYNHDICPMYHHAGHTAAI